MTVPLYDAGALIAAEAGNRQLWSDQRRMLARRLLPIVPASVVAQVSRGARQAHLNMFLAPCRIIPLDAAGARVIGGLLAASGTADIVDADVVRVARDTDATVYTSDRADLEHLATSIGARLTIVDV